MPVGILERFPLHRGVLFMVMISGAKVAEVRSGRKLAVPEQFRNSLPDTGWGYSRPLCSRPTCFPIMFVIGRQRQSPSSFYRASFIEELNEAEYTKVAK